MSQIRSAIVGGGFIGRVHAKAVLAHGATLGAVLAADPETTSAVVRELGADRVYASYAEMLADPEIDLVHICTPNHLHFAQAMAAIQAGKHVICEKPLGISPIETAELVAAAETAGVVAAVPFVYRFYPAVRDARVRARSGELGEIRLLHGHYLQDWCLDPHEFNWRIDPAQGGRTRAFGDIGVHWCDLIEFVSGEQIASVSARMTTVQKRFGPEGALVEVETEDAAAFMFVTTTGAMGSALVSQVSPGRANELLIAVDGSKASISFNQMLPDSLWIGQPDQNTTVWRGSAGMSSGAGHYSHLPSGHPQGYQDAFNSFYRDVALAIGGESVEGLPDFVDGHRAAAITAAILASAATGTWQEVAQ